LTVHFACTRCGCCAMRISRSRSVLGVQNVGVVDHDEGHGQYRSSSSLSAARSSAAARRSWSSRRL
jgi:hypothetical protein